MAPAPGVVLASPVEGVAAWGGAGGRKRLTRPHGPSESAERRGGSGPGGPALPLSGEKKALAGPQQPVCDRKDQPPGWTPPSSRDLLRPPRGKGPPAGERSAPQGWHSVDKVGEPR